LLLLLQRVPQHLVHGGGVHGEREEGVVEATRAEGGVCEASAWGPDLLDPKPSVTGGCLSDEVASNAIACMRVVST
jgi:hypothetical protein